MVTKHFFKVLFIFTGMILLGLLGVFYINNLDKQDIEEENSTAIAK